MRFRDGFFHVRQMAARVVRGLSLGDLGGWAAKRARDQLREAIDALPEGIVFLDREGRYILWNRRYAEIYSGSADLFSPGVRLEDTLRIGVARGHYPEALGHEEEWLAQRLSLLANPGTRHEQQLADGRWVMIEERRTRDGGTIGIRVDITEMKRREASFRLLYESNPVPMFLVDAVTQEVLSANQSACEHYGYRSDEISGSNVTRLYAKDELDALAAQGLVPTAGESERTWCHLKADGQRIEVTTLSRALSYEGRQTVILAAIDVTERRLAEARIAHMARHDALTNLPNRTLFRERIEGALARQRDAGEEFAVLLMDLDHFKSVNDSLGHSVGDRLLQAVSERLLACLSPEDVVARLGGDEFAILHRTVQGKAAVSETAERLVAAIKEPFELESHNVIVAASIGLAMAPSDGADPERLLKSADLALYRAKARGRETFAFFEPEMDHQLRARRAIERELRDALQRGELGVEYQPLVMLATGEVSGYEALLRWYHPERGTISPTEFIGIAEETGLIGQIGQMVLRRACEDAVNWPSPIKVAVNLSPVQFRTSRILEMVVQTLATTGLAASRLELEITEALLLERSESVLSTLRSLRSLGVGISMDDFGTGYSSLSYLRSFPFTKIKIDKSFVRDLGSSPDSQAIVRAIVRLGASLGMTVTAEGIEEPGDLAYLKAEGCAEGQGFFFSRPKPVEAFSVPPGKDRSAA